MLSVANVDDNNTRQLNFFVNNGIMEIYKDGTKKLDFNDGTLTLDKVVLNVGSFPDYVFKNDYELKPLTEVASFIQSNGHLPNMPSEKEVLEQGMDVAKINTVLVEKIEEMTLYTIDQEERIKKMANQLEKLETMLKQLTAKN